MTAALVGERLGRYLWISGQSLEGLEACRAAVARLPAGRATRPPAPASSAPRDTCSCCSAAGPRRSRLRARTRDRARGGGAPRGGQHPQHHVRRAQLLGRARRPGSSTATRPCASPRERNDIEEITRAYVNLGETLDWAGRIEEAAELAGEGALQRDRAGHRPAGRSAGLRPGAAPAAPGALGRCRRRAGHRDRRGDERGHGGGALAGRALLDALRGRFDESRDTLDEAERSQENAAGVDVDGAAGHHARPSSRSGAGAPTRRATPSSPCSTASSRPTRMPSTSRPSSPSGRGRPPTSPSRARATGDAQAEREAGVVRRDARGARRPSRARRGVPGAAVPARGPAERRHDQAEHARAVGQRRSAAWRDVADALAGVRRALRDRLRALAPGRGDPRRGRRARRRPGRAGRGPRGRLPAARPPAGRGARGAGAGGRGCRWTAAPRRWSRGRWRRRGRAGRPHRARARGPAPRGRGRDQPLDRPGPLHQREDGQRPHLADPGQARRARARRGGGPGHPPRPPDEETEAVPEG